VIEVREGRRSPYRVRRLEGKLSASFRIKAAAELQDALWRRWGDHDEPLLGEYIVDFFPKWAQGQRDGIQLVIARDIGGVRDVIARAHDSEVTISTYPTVQAPSTHSQPNSRSPETTSRLVRSRPRLGDDPALVRAQPATQLRPSASNWARSARSTHPRLSTDNGGVSGRVLRQPTRTRAAADASMPQLGWCPWLSSAPSVTTTISSQKPLRRVYDLRHTFATFALRAGISTFDLSRYMCASLAMIDRHYGHLARDGRHYAIKLLDAFIEPEAVNVHAVDAAWTSEASTVVHSDNGKTS
jgi:hypothetical protein